MPKYKRRKYRKKYKNTLPVKNARRIKKLEQNIDVKHLDTSLGATDMSSTGIITYMCDVDEGDGENERSGDTIRVKHLLIRGNIKGQSTEQDGIFRLVVFKWRKKLAATTVGMAYPMEANSPLSLYNLENKGNFKIYYDQTSTIDKQLRSNIPFKISVKLNTLVRYDGTATGTEDHCTENPIYFAVYSDLTAGDQCPHIYWQARLTYVD